MPVLNVLNLEEEVEVVLPDYLDEDNLLETYKVKIKSETKRKASRRISNAIMDLRRERSSRLKRFQLLLVPRSTKLNLELKRLRTC